MGEVQKRKKSGIICAAAITLLAAMLFLLVNPVFGGGRGYSDYTIQMEQYFAEYTEQYDYWDVITVEYPVLSGTGEQEEAVNGSLFDIAMDKVDYWHLFPNNGVKQLQEEYQLYCSDVRCDVTFHSQYLLSAVFYESYAPMYPIYYVHKTRRGANVNLMTGEVYELPDILQLNDDFLALWCRRASEEYVDVIYDDEDTRETFRQWFLDEDEELKELYMFCPFFHVTEEGDFVVGLSIDPDVKTVLNDLALDSSFSVRFSSQELLPYRTESDFWEWYEKSESAGEVLPCEDLQENIWMREDSGIWDYT